MRFFSLQQLWALKMPFLSISMFDVIEIRPRFYRCAFYHVLPCFTHQRSTLGKQNTSAFLYLFGFPDFSNFSLLIASSRQSSCFAGSLRIHFDINWTSMKFWYVQATWHFICRCFMVLFGNIHESDLLLQQPRPSRESPFSTKYRIHLRWSHIPEEELQGGCRAAVLIIQQMVTRKKGMILLRYVWNVSLQN